MTTSVDHRDVESATDAWFLHHGLTYFVPEQRAHVRQAARARRVIPFLLLVAVVASGAGGVVAWAADQLTLGPATLASLLVLAAGWYALTALHAAPIVTWALARTFGSLRSLLPMTTRALPLLLLFITFLFINTEVWQVSSALTRPVLWLSVAFFAALAVVFLVVRLPEEVAAVNDDLDPDVVRRAVRGTPLEPHLDDLDDVHAEPLDRRQRTNLLLVLLVTQASQVLLLSLSVWLFFLVFGRVAIDESVIATWVGHGAPHYPLVLGRLGVSRELLQVSIFLSAFSGLYFTVYAVTDSTYRDQFFHEITHELERAVGVRAAYLALRRIA
jgi:hypothetical protein